MKIAINRYYGSFNLSDKAIAMIMKRKGLECHRYVQTKHFYENEVNYTKISPDEVGTSRKIIYYLTKDVGEIINELPDEYYWYYNKELERNDKDLIAVIEELGKEAEGDCSKICIVEIPDDISWEIYNEAGFESIHEKHRIWC